MFDQIPAAVKPTGGVNFHMGSGGSNGAIEVDAGDDDTLLTITASTSNSATIVTNDGNDSGMDTTVGDSGEDLIGTGVNHIDLQTNDLNGISSPSVSDHYPNGGSKVYVPSLAGGLYLRVDTGDATFDTVELGDGSSIGQDCTVKTGAGDDTVDLENGGGDDHCNAVIDFGSGSGNELDVFGAGNATLDYVDRSSGAMNVDRVTVSGDGASDPDGTITIAAPATIGDLAIQAHGDVTATGGPTVTTCEVESGGTLSVTTTSATFTSLTVDSGGCADLTADTGADTLIVDGDAIVEAPLTAGDFSLDGTVSFTGGSASSSANTLELSGTLDMDASSDLGVDTLSCDSNGTIDAANTSTLNIETADVSSTLTFDLTSTANVTVGTFDASSGTIDVNDGGLLTIENASTINTLNVTGVGASVLVQTTSTDFTFALRITDGGLLTLQARADSPSSSSARVLIAESLDLGPTSSPTGTLDLEDNDLIVAPDGSGQFGDVQAWIIDGYNGAAWTGAGIDSSVAASNGYTGLGYVSASDIFSTFPVSFDGVNISAGSAVIVKYTWYGDANLSGTVNTGDFNRYLINGNTSGDDWWHADFNYDGNCNSLDFTAISNNWNKSAL